MALSCQRCGIRPATIHVTEVQPGGPHHEAHLCQACCQEAGWLPDTPPPPVAELLAVPAPAEAGTEAGAGGADDPPCPHCGLRLSEYQQVNLFGCRHDYEVFADEVLELVRRWHGADRHVGRRPGDAGPAAVDTARAALEAELAAAVSEERYEEAARLRDELRRLG